MYQYVIVALLSSFEIYVAIASGLAFNMTSNEIFIATLIGGISGVFVFAFLGDKISNFIARFRKKKEETEESTSKKILNNLWNKYGKFGVGFIGTFLVGAPLSIAVGVGFGANVKQLISYCLVAVAIRCVVYSYFFGYVKDLF